MAYLGKEFVLYKQENFDSFLDILDVSAETKKALITFKPTSKIVKNGDEYTYTYTKVDGSTKSYIFKSGVEYDDNTYGRTAKVVTTVDGDTYTQVQKYPEETLTFKRQFSPDELVETITNSKWDGQAKRYFKAK